MTGLWLLTPSASERGSPVRPSQIRSGHVAGRRPSPPVGATGPQHRIFGPLGMHDSSLVLPPEHRDRRVFGGHGLPTTIRSGWWPGIDAPELDEADWGGHGLASTTWDTAIFAQMLFQGRSLRRPRGAQRGGGVGHDPRPARAVAGQASPVNQRVHLRRSDLELSGGGYGYGVFLAARGDRFLPTGPSRRARPTATPE